MRRSHLSLAVALVAILASPVPHPAAGGEDRAPPRPDRPVGLPGSTGPSDQAAPEAAPYAQVATDVDLAVVVPELQAAFAERYGGYWLEIGRRSDTMHVAVVGATRQDAATVARLTDHHPRVTTDAVTHGYDALLAAQEEIARSLATSTDFTVGVDVAANEVVVQTESRDVRATASVAQSAARRGGARAHRQDGGRAPARDLGAAVRVQAATPITVAAAGPADLAAPTNPNRNVFPPYESGLRALIAISSTTRAVCTSGFVLRNGSGWYGTVAGHCGAWNRRVAFGSTWADVVRANGYTRTSRVAADVALVSLSIRRWPSRPVVHATGTRHPLLVGRLTNAAIGRGLRLCFEGVTSDTANCGPVNLTRQWVCCDGTRRQFYYSCIGYPSRPGDSGGPVYQVLAGGRANAAGMVSSSVTIGGRASTCFSLIQTIEGTMRSTIYLR
jgi:hypothetical protein